MANSDTPTGLTPVRYMSGAPYTGATERFYVPASDSTAIFVGDPVRSAGSADARGVASVQRAGIGSTILGVVTSVVPVTRDSETYRPANSERYVNVCTAKDVVYEVQSDATGALVANDVGLNADIVNGTGSAITGLSGVELDSSSADTATAQLRIIGFVQREDNEIGANAKVEVIINEHERSSAVGV
ncbi:MAG: hypothetical protein AAF607_10165 [Pseudomonadota bacterium]